jgi:hypothetical protein
MNKSVRDIIEEVTEEVCSNLCKYPTMYSPDEWEEKYEEICNKCPLNKL